MTWAGLSVHVWLEEKSGGGVFKLSGWKSSVVFMETYIETLTPTDMPKAT